MAHRVTLIPGDGTGPELVEATRRVLEATGVEFDWDVQPAGEEVMHEHGGNPLPPTTLESIRQNKVALKGPITTPVGGGFRSVNVGLRKELDMYAQVRPCKSYPGVRSRFQDVDLVIIRENTEDLYAGIEYEQGTPDAEELIRWIGSKGGKLRWDDAGISIKPISVTGTRRIFEFAFDWARRNGRKQITAVHKANIMKFSDGLWLRVAREVAAENEDIVFNDRIVDNMCMQLVQRPEEYDVLVLPTLYGDVLSDLCAGMIGGHGDQMVPLISATTVGGVPLRKLVSEDRIAEMVQRTAVGGGEIVKLLGTSAWYAPGAACAQMVDSIMLDEKRVLPCTAYLEGEYGIEGLYMGVPVKLGATGIEQIYEVDLDESEQAALAKSADAVREVVGVLTT